MTLNDLAGPSAHRYKIVALNATGPLLQRLEEMGFFVGAEIEVSGRLPFRGPWIVHLGSSSFALRADEALALEIGEAA